MSEHSLLQPVTIAEFRSFYGSLQQQMVAVEQNLDAWIVTGVETILQRLNLSTNADTQARHPFTRLEQNGSTLSATSSVPHITPPQVPSVRLAPAAPPAGTTNTGLSPSVQQAEDPLEVPVGLSIPRIPMKGRKKEHSLEDILDHWENPNPRLGLIRALQDWPDAWFTGKYWKKFLSKRDQRKQIALEFIDE